MPQSRIFLPTASGGSTGGSTDINSTDNLFLREQVSKVFDKRVLQDSVMLADSCTSTRLRFLVDTIFLRDQRQAVRNLVAQDSVFLRDQRLSLLTKLIREALFLYDDRLVSTFPGGTGGTLYTRSALDNLYLSDVSRRARDARILDRLLVLDLVSKTLAKAMVDKILVGDSATAVKGLLDILLRDGILMFDHSLRQYQKRVQDGVLLHESERRERTLHALDKLFFYDSATASRAREVLIAAIDRIFVSDRQSRVRDVVKFDAVQLHETMRTLRDMLSRDTLDLLDSILVQLYSVLVEWLVSARLNVVDYLGRRIGFVDFLSLRAGLTAPKKE